LLSAVDAGAARTASLSTTSETSTLEVVSVEVDRLPTRVYNFEVADVHSYAVGELNAWVHNAKSFWDKLTPWKGKMRRDACGNIYYKDFLHKGELEKFSPRNKFLGSVSQKRGKPIPGKGPESDPGRTIKSL
jgi:hypothetical protein